MKKLYLALMALTVSAPVVYAGGEVNVYSYRQEFLVEPLFKAFEAKTGHKVNVKYAKSGLIEKVQSEGKNTPADVIMTVDIANLKKIKDLGISENLSTPTLRANIPTSMRDRDGAWFGLSQRTRIIYASKERVNPNAITSYLDLAKPEWQGKICMRPATHNYNIGLFSYMIALHGEQQTKQWLRGLKANQARPPQGNDRAQVKAIYEGVCDVAIGNEYYYGKMLADSAQVPWAKSVNIIWPNQDKNGVHTNLAGIALTKYAPHREVAIALIEYLSSLEAQTMFAEGNYERPVNPQAKVSDTVKSWYPASGTLKIDYSVSLTDIANNAPRALELVNQVGLNQ